MNRAIAALLTTVLIMHLSGSASAQVLKPAIKASWYSAKSLVKEGTRKAGEKQIMANGKEFNENAMTAACRLYPLGTKLLITNLQNKKSVVVVVSDRIGKRFAKTRIDLTRAAFRKIAKLEQGIAPITVKVS